MVVDITGSFHSLRSPIEDPAAVRGLGAVGAAPQGLANVRRIEDHQGLLVQRVMGLLKNGYTARVDCQKVAVPPAAAYGLQDMGGVVGWSG